MDIVGRISGIEGLITDPMLHNGGLHKIPTGGKFASGEVMMDAQVADLDGDDHLDLVTTGANTGNVYVLMGVGDGTFRAPVAVLAAAVKAGGKWYVASKEIKVTLGGCGG